MEFRASVTPKFDSKEIIDTTLAPFWAEFQLAVYEVSESILSYLQNYINSHAKRKENSGLLARSINLIRLHGPAEVGFLIGEIAKLPPYWRIINYGGMTTATLQGWTIQGYFGSGNPPDSSKSGSGVGNERWHSQWGTFAMQPKTAIKPMNYIEAVELFTALRINEIIAKTKKG